MIWKKFVTYGLLLPLISIFWFLAAVFYVLFLAVYALFLGVAFLAGSVAPLRTGPMRPVVKDAWREALSLPNSWGIPL